MTAGDGCDRGRTAVGAAELASFGGTDLETQRPLDELASRAATVCSTLWWARAGGPPVRIAAARASARSSSARGGGARGRDAVTIRLAEGQRDLATVGHELAHALAGVEHGHDQRFRIAAVDVVSVLAGHAAAEALRRSFEVYDLPLAERPWPAPARLEGDTFVVL